MKKVGVYVGLLCLAICAMVGCNKIQENYTEPESGSGTVQIEENDSTENLEDVDADGELGVEPNTELNSVTEGSVYSASCPTGESVEPIYAINKLPAMDNRYYAKWGENIYFRQYNAASVKEGELWADFEYSPKAFVEKDLMCMDTKGNITCVGKDYGFGPIYIAEVEDKGPRIISIRIAEEGSRQIYSCDLKGENIEEIYDGDYFLDFDGMYAGKLFFSDASKLFILEMATCNITVVPEVEYAEWFAYSDEAAYFRTGDSEVTEISVYYYDNGETEKIVKIDWDELLSEEERNGYDGTMEHLPSTPVVSDSELIEDELYFQLVCYAGSSNTPHYGAVFYIDLVTNTCAKVSNAGNGAPFKVVKDDENTWVYQYKTEHNDETDSYEYVVYATQICGSDAAPAGVMPWCEQKKLTQTYYQYGEYDLIATPDDSGYSYIVLSKEEIDALGIDNPSIIGESNGEIQWNIVRAEYVDDKLFFSVEISDHDSENDIGWRYYYSRRITYDYCKDLSTGEVILLQSY